MQDSQVAIHRIRPNTQAKIWVLEIPRWCLFSKGGCPTKLTNDNMDSIVEFHHVFPHGGAANAGVALGAHVVSKSHDDLLDLLGQLPSGGQDQSLAARVLGVDLLKDRDGEGGGFAGSGLGLGDDIVSLDAGNNSTLLDSRGFLETVSINAAKQFFSQLHVIEVLANLIPVGINETFGVHAGGAVVASTASLLGGGAVGFPLILSRGSGKKMAKN